MCTGYNSPDSGKFCTFVCRWIVRLCGGLSPVYSDRTRLNSTSSTNLIIKIIDTLADATQLSPTIGNANDPVEAYSQSARTRSVELSWLSCVAINGPLAAQLLWGCLLLIIIIMIMPVSCHCKVYNCSSQVVWTECCTEASSVFKGGGGWCDRPPPPPDGLTVNFLIICALSVNFVSRLNRKIRVKMHSNLSFWGQKNDFSGEGLSPLHHIPPPRRLRRLAPSLLKF